MLPSLRVTSRKRGCVSNLKYFTSERFQVEQEETVHSALRVTWPFFTILN